MLEFIAASTLGVLIGALTGLVPGIHSNTVVFLSLPLYFGISPPTLIYMSFVAGLSVSHTFHNSLPSIFLGLAEAETALVSLPGPELASEGRGMEAFLLTLRGGIEATFGFIIVSPVLFFGLDLFYGLVSSFMFHILMFFLFLLVFSSEDVLKAATVALLSGLLGILAFKAPVNQAYVLLPVFSGLFSIPSIIIGLRNSFELPAQKEETGSSDGTGSEAGMLAGVFAGIFPGLGAATTTSFLAPMLEDRESFLRSMGAVDTADIYISFIALMIIGKSRSGASVALSYLKDFTWAETFFMVGLSVFSASISVPAALKTMKLFVRALSKVSARKIFLLSAVCVLTSSFWLTGLTGLLVLFTSGFIGYAASLRNVRRGCMAVLIVPAMEFYAKGLTL